MTLPKKFVEHLQNNRKRNYRFLLLSLLILACFYPYSILRANDSLIKTDDPPVEVSLVLKEGRLIVPLIIDGLGKQYFILDTAASISVISERLRDQLKITPEDTFQDTVKGASGISLIEKVMLPDLEFGNRVFSDLDAVVFKTSDFRNYDNFMVEGILGTDVLKNFNVQIELAKQRINLLPLKSPFTASGTDNGISFHSRAAAGFVEFTTTLNNRPIYVILDSGASRTLLNWQAANTVGINENSSALNKRVNGTKGIDGNGNIETFLYTFDKLKLGPAEMHKTEVKIANIPIFDILGIGEEPAMLAGADIISNCRVTINYGTGRFFLCN